MTPRPQSLTSLVKKETVQKEFILPENDRPKIAYNQFSNEIPVISLEGIDEDFPGRRREVILKRVAEACEEWGIFQVVNHGVDPKLVHDMTNLSTKFFALPDEEKLRFGSSGAKKGVPSGFIVSSPLQNESVENWKEMVVYNTYPIKDRDYTRWPNKPEEWQTVTEAYSEKLMGLGLKLLQVLSEIMGLEKDSITKACKEMAQRLVVNNYPRCPQPDLVVGIKRHTDVNVITLLLQDQVGGLQVTKDDGRNWITVQPIEGAFIVNIGDFGHYLSNGRFKSAEHQVVVNNVTSRLSIATFIKPAEDAIAYPLKVEEGKKPIIEKPIAFTELYRMQMIFYLKQSQLNKLIEEKLPNEDKDKLIQSCLQEPTPLDELLT